MPERMQAKAKLDTGALTSVMDARNITRIKKNDERWVQYDVMLTDPATGKEERLPFERRVERVLKFKTASGVERAPVVLMDICLGGKVLREQFTLRDRADPGLPGAAGASHPGTPGAGRRVPNLHPQTYLQRARPRKP